MAQGKENAGRREGGMFKRLSQIFVNTDIAEIIQQEIELSILRGDIKRGEKMPSIKEFIEIYSIGYQTSNKLQNTFRSNGLAESHPGKGVFYSFNAENKEELKKKYTKKLKQELKKAEVYADALKINIKELNDYMPNKKEPIKGLQYKHIFNIFSDIDKAAAIQQDIELSLIRGEIKNGDNLLKILEMQECYDVGHQTSVKVHKIFKDAGLTYSSPGKRGGATFSYSTSDVDRLKKEYRIKLIAVLNKANIYINTLYG